MKEFYLNLNTEEKKVFDLYKGNPGSFAHLLNDSLRFGKNGYENEIKILDEIIKKYECQKEITLHRATVAPLVVLFIHAGFYTNPEYLSTAEDLESIKEHFSNPNNPVYMQFICPAGTNMAPMEANVLYGEHEKEFLLGRYNRFLVQQDYIITDRAEIEDIMDRDKAHGVSELRVIVCLRSI